MQVLEAKPELASFTFFNYSMNVMHYAAGTHFELLPAALLHIVTCKWGRQTEPCLPIMNLCLSVIPPKKALLFFIDERARMQIQECVVAACQGGSRSAMLRPNKLGARLPSLVTLRCWPLRREGPISVLLAVVDTLLATPALLVDFPSSTAYTSLNHDAECRASRKEGPCERAAGGGGHAAGRARGVRGLPYDQSIQQLLWP